MITDALLLIVFGPLNAVAGLLPTTPALNLNTKATSLVSGGLFAHLGWVNNYIPLNDVSSCIAIILTIAALLIPVNLLIYLATKLHLLGGK